MAQAVDARKLVGQAMGILMERFDLDGDRAFEVLKRYSQDNNLTLRDVANHLVHTRADGTSGIGTADSRLRLTGPVTQRICFGLFPRRTLLDARIRSRKAPRPTTPVVRGGLWRGRRGPHRQV